MLKVLQRRVIKILTNFYDPITTLKIGTKTIKIPLSHALREIVVLYPEYNFNLARIVKHVSNKRPNVSVIDIGANIGDTVAFIKNEVDVPILCIDGESGFVKLLKENISQYSNVSVCMALVGAENAQVNYKLKTDKGTAHIETGSDSTSMRTLENILEDHPNFRKSKVIKLDTDGFDTIILRSCEQYLRTVCPVLFFEFDPHLIKKNNDDAFEFMNFLKKCGYYYFIFYTNVGDYLVSCSASEEATLNELIHYFSGRKLDLFADVCAFEKGDKDIYDYISQKEIEHFQQVRNY